MWKKIQYGLLLAVFYPLSVLPMPVLYFLGDLVYPILYYIVKYRRDVVRGNLSASFPEKTESEIREIERGFYHFFCDYVVETVKLLTISRKQMQRRMKFVNGAEVDALADGKRPIFAYIGHLANWEYIISIPMWVPSLKVYHIYHELSSEPFDRLMCKIRGRFDSIGVTMHRTARTLIGELRQGTPYIVGLIADQRPEPNAIRHWTTFMNREAPVIVDTERLGQKLGAIYFYMDVQRPRRGYYEITMLPIKADESAPFSVTEQYFRMLEDNIRRLPSMYLWSHRRWSLSHSRTGQMQ
ncbi:MAG: lysophospholipid acyltransferase family protein [Bacteroidales bacterium]|nr:lysophospholipid acyltransferase family protein [Bacteroidales bacterium]